MNSTSSPAGSRTREHASFDEHDFSEAPRGRVERLGSVRVPVTLQCAPRATLYRLPDGRVLAVVRLWNFDRVERRALGVERLRQYARRSGLRALVEAIDRTLESAGVEHEDP
jgi:hypothetical protein